MGKWVASITLLLLASVGWYAYQDLHKPLPESVVDAQATAVLPPEIPKQIYTTHSFKDGEHRVIGDFFLPHSCYAVDQTVIPEGGKLVFVFTVKDKITDLKLCVKIPTRYPFILLSEGAKDAPLEFQVNDQVVPTVIRETTWENPSGGLIDARINTH